MQKKWNEKKKKTDEKTRKNGEREKRRKENKTEKGKKRKRMKIVLFFGSFLCFFSNQLYATVFVIALWYTTEFVTFYNIPSTFT